jgi:NAD(P)-dependent dehydrogenase (short-subunit alcohol dehydrogenase family)
MAASTPAAVVLGARNLGAVITRDLLGRGMRVATVARTQADLEALAVDGAVPIRGDAADAARLDLAIAQAAERIGPADVIVNAVSPDRPPPDGTGFGGGPIAAATPAGFDGWMTAVARQAFVFLGAGARALHGRRGTLIQILGGPARRANPERGLFAAGSAAARALTHAAAQELRGDGIHVALLIVDGIIASPKTVQMARNMPAEALVRPQDVAAAVRYLATQSRRGMTHELVVTPGGDRWLP